MEKFKINKKLLNFTIWLFLLVFMGGVAGLSGVYLFLSPNLPEIDSLKEVQLQTPLRVYSIDNKLIGEFGEKRRDPISIDESPQALINAIISAEDDDFYQHSGVDIKGLLRAISQLALSGEIQSGGSTITMQVARNFFLSREQTFSRKFNEILLALKIERYLSKSEVLELYLNKIYLGNRAYGVKAAAQVYYGLPLSQLSLAQTAMIAGLPKAPSTFNPIVNPNRALIRRNWILKRMASLKKITQEELGIALKEPVTARFHGQNLDLDAPYIAEAAREYAL
jgi:penicillin-binding protein 1A